MEADPAFSVTNTGKERQTDGERETHTQRREREAEAKGERVQEKEKSPSIDAADVERRSLRSSFSRFPLSFPLPLLSSSLSGAKGLLTLRMLGRKERASKSSREAKKDQKTAA